MKTALKRSYNYVYRTSGCRLRGIYSSRTVRIGIEKLLLLIEEIDGNDNKKVPFPNSLPVESYALLVG